MLSRIIKRHFKMEEQDEYHKQRQESSMKSSVAVGLRILVQISNGKSNIVVKSAVRPRHRHTITYDYCFFKTCNLCNMGLSLDKEVYMYRGDQGFCSIECRDRQILLDEMKELEASTKQMIASYRNCYNTSSRRNNETSTLLQDIISHRHKPLIPRQRNRAIFSLVVDHLYI